MERANRIFITGTSGVGKTTLAKFISQRFGLPYISTSASILWPKYGFTSHADALRKCMANPEIGFLYQREILSTRIEALVNEKEFVTDRGPIDNLAYFLLQQAYHSDENNSLFITACGQLHKLGDKTIFLTLPDESAEAYTIEDNEKRITSMVYQRLVDNTMQMVVDEYFNNYNVLYIKVWDMEYRKRVTEDFIKGIL
jgi:thymidylate kinase